MGDEVETVGVSGGSLCSRATTVKPLGLELVAWLTALLRAITVKSLRCAAVSWIWFPVRPSSSLPATAVAVSGDKKSFSDLCGCAILQSRSRKIFERSKTSVIMPDVKMKNTILKISERFSSRLKVVVR